MTSTATNRTFSIDPSHTGVGFSVRHLMIAKVRGTFGTVSGTVQLPPDGSIPTSVTATIDVSSIDTREPNRDTHLKSPDFFDTETYPTMTFTSTTITAEGATEFTMAGDLTIHGTTKSVTFRGEATGEGNNPFAPGTRRVAYEAKTKIKRSEFGLEWNSPMETGGVVISDEVEITLDVQAVG